MDESSNRFLLGHVSADSGQLILIDPCYLRDWEDGEFRIEGEADNDYARCCMASLSVEGCGSVFDDLAVCFSTGWGDGAYPVYATKEDGRIVKVEILMNEAEQEAEEGEDV